MKLSIIRTQPVQRNLKAENAALLRQIEALKAENSKILLKLENSRLRCKLAAAKNRLLLLERRKQDIIMRKQELEYSRRMILKEIGEYLAHEQPVEDVTC